MSLASRSAASRSPAPPQPCKTKDPVRFQRQGVLPPLSPAPALQIAQRCDPAGWSGRQSASGRTALPTCCLLLAARRPLSRCPLPACTVADRSLSLAGRCGIRVSILPFPPLLSLPPLVASVFCHRSSTCLVPLIIKVGEGSPRLPLLHPMPGYHYPPRCRCKKAAPQPLVGPKWKSRRGEKNGRRGGRGVLPEKRTPKPLSSGRGIFAWQRTDVFYLLVFG